MSAACHCVTPKYDWPDIATRPSDQGCAAASTRSKIAEAETVRRRFMQNPIGRRAEPFGEQADVEAQMPGANIDRFFFAREQIEEQRGEAGVVQGSWRRSGYAGYAGCCRCREQRGRCRARCPARSSCPPALHRSREFRSRARCSQTLRIGLGQLAAFPLA